MKSSSAAISAVVIGRNEGERLIACLASLPDRLARVIYVDSGSTDGSIAAAASRGAEVIELDIAVPFTAARARNAGIEALQAGQPPDYVQFIDGDCALDSAWLNVAAAYLDDHSDVAVVFGRRRERFPQHSVYNRLCDAEWDTPVGEATECGGDTLMRWSALQDAGGFNPGLIAGEEPDLCLRLRRQGWKIWRLDHEMTLHDAAIMRFGQFWQRARRAGHAAAEGQAMHGNGPERFRKAEMRRVFVWTLAIPCLILLCVLLAGPVALSLLLIYPLQVVRLALKGGGGRFAWEQSLLFTIGKFAELRGALDFYWRRFRGHKAMLIEYK